MFAANIWLTSALTVTAIFSASALYKSYSDIQEAKQIQEHYELVTEIKILIAKQYNKNPQDVTREEIIAHLPTGANWGKILLLDRNDNSDLSNKAFVNEAGKIFLDESEKLKLLALRAKLRDTLNTTTVTLTDGKYIFDVGFNKNIKQKDKAIEENLDKMIAYLIQQTIYTSGTITESTLNNILTTYTPQSDIYHDLTNIGATTDDEETKKKKFFKLLLKDRLKKNENTLESRLYYILKDLL